MKIEHTISRSNTNYNKKNNTYFIVGFCMFCLFTGLIGLRTNEGLNKFYELFQIIGLFFIAKILKNSSPPFESEVFKILFILLMLWSTFIIINGNTIDYNSIKRFILGHGTKYLVPFAIFLPQTLDFYKKLFWGITILGILFFLASFSNISLITTIYTTNVEQKFSFEILAWELALPSGLILFTYRYHKRKVNIFAFLTILFVLLVSAYTARRSYVFLTTVEFLLFLVVYFKETKNKFFTVTLFTIFIGIALFFGSQLLDKNFEQIFLGKLQERSTEDTRSNLELALMTQLTEKEWLIGRGINGKYNYSESIETTDEAGNRDMIEGQILDTILKGGIIHLFLLLIIIVPATIKNLFFSNNLLSKGFGFMMLLFLLSLYPVNYIKFNLFYLIVWIGVAIGYSKSTRQIPDILIRKYFKIQ